MKTQNGKLQLLALALAVSLGLSSQLGAETLRQHDAHVHGQAVGNLTLDGGDLRLELEIPGVNLVGFEHPPRDQGQRDQLDAVLAALGEADWLDVDARGRCVLDAVNAHTHGFDEDDDDHDHDSAETNGEAGNHGHQHEESHRHGHEHHRHHDHDEPTEHSHRHDHEHDQDHDHGHDQDHDHGGSGSHSHDDHHHDHAEFHIVVRWQCEAPDALRWVDVKLFDDYPGNERIVLNVLTDHTANQFRLEPGRVRASLEP